MLTPKELALIAHYSMQLGLLSSEDSQFLITTSSKISLGDILSNQQQEDLNKILSIIASKKVILLIEEKLPTRLTMKILKYQKNNDDNERYTSIVKNEIRTGLLATEVKKNININFSSNNEDSTSFFKIKERGPSIDIILNKEHIFFNEIQKYKNQTDAYDLILNMLAAWSCYECSLHSEKETEIIRESREEWGKELRNRLRK